ncbi:MAG: bifunctional tRNA (5-methylaminomethyl-2-thiouridine)(34)-methyltransferase MnmD/FAD-dependent 5-carboxymethylaminomethyl-2-thiouridine(34) oxidoreductase MnmC [Saccharospirillaceae bacterium]|nr:bifunctional tRNA (5-methylaminomethyl-2-thiouridine)(34)-methyltransferase MnmD/FAD-dependent 5-carboxymethylaminomethyl-2-thiouridine(34) oxidoreductase MnmC [Pseudomonadales bacterium]NRB79357.1 bifunctional tRNA (5-methylaminomethyl-2-thiouridine)(34)-methyltransferase MnmD/FAD-dependent 5-carboxymethylaminomethyl-2-thiouridine(34) oxidoreductase MnmC [Saccharospirillaceae bacterium]
MKSPIEPAKVSFNQRGTLQSDLFGDLYFSNQGALEEIEHNFLTPNTLSERFKKLKDNRVFTVGETGFGTGLNFFKTWQLFELHSPSNTRLHFISVEKHPLTKVDLILALQNFPSLKNQTTQLLEQYPKLLPGFHTLHFKNITLTLIFADAFEGLEQCHAKVDAWFLDGFMPDSNSKMWDIELFQQIARLSHLETTASTLSCARIVKDVLIGAGFKCKTKKGFAKKRKILTATFIGLCGPSNAITNQFYSLHDCKTHFTVKKIAVIGAGFSGCSTAYELNKSGHNVTLFDQQSDIAKGASSNSKAAMYLKPGSKNSYNNRFYLSAFFHSLRQAQTQNLPIENCGMIQLIHNEKEFKKQKELITCGLYFDAIFEQQDATQLSKTAGISINKDGLFYPHGAMATPKDLCVFWAKDINFINNCQIINIEKKENNWLLTNQKNKEFVFDKVIICNAYSASQFEQSKHLPLKNIRGQVSDCNAGEQSKHIKTVICGEQYITPARNNQHCFGATFDLKDDDSSVRQSDNIKNINNIERMLPSIAGELIADNTVGKTGFRCTTPDYMPVVGPCVPAKEYCEQFRHIQNKKLRSIKKAPVYDGLFINVGFGSKGASTASLCAEIIKCLINEQSMPIEIDLLDHLHPGRFLIRDISRKKSSFLVAL